MKKYIYLSVLIYCTQIMFASELVRPKPDYNTNGLNNIILTKGVDYSLSNMFQDITCAKEVSNLQSQNDLYWLAGSWTCELRILRDSMEIHNRYIYIKDILINKETIYESKTSKSDIYIEAKLLYVFPSGKDERTIDLECNNQGLWLQMPVGDNFVLLKDPGISPKYFILKHKITKDVMYFRRVTAKARNVNDDNSKI